MRKVLVSMAAVGVALAAVPAMAQWNNGGGYGQPNYGDNNGYGRGGSVTPRQVRDMVERAIDRGEVSRHDARELREDVRNLIQLEQRARWRDDYSKRREIDRRTADILRDLQRARRDGGRGYGNGNPDGPNGGWREPRGDNDRYYNR